MTPDPKKRKPKGPPAPEKSSRTITRGTPVKPVEKFEVGACPPEFIRRIQQLAEGGDARNIENQDPFRAAVAMWRLAQGVSLNRVCQETGFERLTLRNLAIRHQSTLSDQKAKFAAMYAQAASEYTELLFEKADRMRDNPEQLDQLSPDRLALTVGIMTDQAAKLSGMASSIIEHRKGASIEDASEMIAAARARVAEKLRARAIEAEVLCDA